MPEAMNQQLTAAKILVKDNLSQTSERLMSETKIGIESMMLQRCRDLRKNVLKIRQEIKANNQSNTKP